VGTTWADIRPQWRYDANSDVGFGNSFFVDTASGYDPFSVQNGVLSITAKPDPAYPGLWESGPITTQGHFSQTYGYFEIRGNFSTLPGGWDAFWLLPNQVIPDPNNVIGRS
jgi:beta-glucanase (GH16 family)